jgi:hypothetical protein
MQGCANNLVLQGLKRRRSCGNGEVSSIVAAVQGLLDLTANAPVYVDTAGSDEAGDQQSIEVDLSIPAIVHVSSDSSAFIFSEDDPSFVDHLLDTDLSGDNFFDSDDDSKVVETRKKKGKDLVGQSYVVEEPLKVDSRK